MVVTVPPVPLPGRPRLVRRGPVGRRRRCQSPLAPLSKESFQRLSELTPPPTTRPAPRPSLLARGSLRSSGLCSGRLALGSGNLLGEVGVEPHEPQHERHRTEQHPAGVVDRHPGLHRTGEQQHHHDDVEPPVGALARPAERAGSTLGDRRVEDDHEAEHGGHGGLRHLDRHADQADAQQVLDELVHPERTSHSFDLDHRESLGVGLRQPAASPERSCRPDRWLGGWIAVARSSSERRSDTVVCQRADTSAGASGELPERPGPGHGRRSWRPGRSR